MTQPPSVPPGIAPLAEDVLALTFWGVRGSIPAPGRRTLRYGGETTCMQIDAGARTLLIDCGSGVRHAGRALRGRGIDSLDVLFTHTHMDHIAGLPFFCLAYDPNVEVNLWGGHIPPGGTLEEIVERMMSPPIFPVATSALSNTHFRRFGAGDDVALGGNLSVATTLLNHPGRACGYRIAWGGSVIAIITDHEHGNPEIDAAVREFVTGADVMVYDAMYREAEYATKVGWGHSTPEQCLELAARAGVAMPVLFHHDPCRSDDDLDVIAAELGAQMPSLRIATEGETIALRAGSLVAAPFEPA